MNYNTKRRLIMTGFRALLTQPRNDGLIIVALNISRHTGAGDPQDVGNVERGHDVRSDQVSSRLPFLHTSFPRRRESSQSNHRRRRNIFKQRFVTLAAHAHPCATRHLHILCGRFRALLTQPRNDGIIIVALNISCHTGESDLQGVGNVA